MTARALLVAAARVAVGPLLLALGGCGWHTGLVAPEGVDSLGVAYFVNETPEPDIEVELAREMVRSVTKHMDTRVRGVGEADALIRGTITDYRRRPGIRSDENRLAETGVRIAVRAMLVDATTGEILRRAETGIWSNFAIDDLDNEVDARTRALRYLADQVVLDLFAGKPASLDGVEEGDDPDPADSSGAVGDFEDP